jgi:sugar fermentation stimulation protein A
MELVNLYDGKSWVEVGFVERLNRFVMRFEMDSGEIVDAHAANPGRMEEFRVPGHRFFLIPAERGKYRYRVVSTVYQGSFVLLDTIKVNNVVERLLRGRKIAGFEDYPDIRREVSMARSKFDFMLGNEKRGLKPLMLEVKSCNLVHGGVAMFPDAPTDRGRRHLRDLDDLAGLGEVDTAVLYLISNYNARVFMPNRHTDPEYCRTMAELKGCRSYAFRLKLTDPVTVDLDSLEAVPIDLETPVRHCGDNGSYLLVMRNVREVEVKVGALGKRVFAPGYYVYVGSAMKGLEARVKRHRLKSKKVRWHIDYVLPAVMGIEKVYLIRNKERLEEAMARRMMGVAPAYVEGFGASDTDLDSHLFYFGDEKPWQRRDFLDLLFDFQMDRSLTL